MFRFLIAALFVFTGFAAHAQESTPEKLSPPISGDMFKMKVFDEPIALPSLMFSSTDKGLVYLSEYRPKLVVMNIWATWCPPCVGELPSLNALQHAMGGKMFDVVTVSLNMSSPDDIKKYMVDNKLDALPGFVDINEALPKLEALKDANGIPISLIISPEMKVLARVDGDVDWNGPAARAVLEYYAKNVKYHY